MNNYNIKEPDHSSPSSLSDRELMQAYELRIEKLSDWNSSQRTELDRQQEAISSINGKSSFIEPLPEKVVSCNCRKTQCLKLYCECFAYKSRCSPLCKCEGCLNNNQNQGKRRVALEAIELRANGPVDSNKIQNLPMRKLKSIKGCSCKKSGCLKKYCQCYNANRKCSELCVCEACKNSSNGCYHPSSKREAAVPLLDQPAPKKKIKQQFLSLEQADRKLDEYLFDLPELHQNNFLRFLLLVLKE